MPVVDRADFGAEGMVVALVTRVADFVSTMKDVTSQNGVASQALEDQLAVFNAKASKALDDLSAKRLTPIKPDPAKANISVYGDTAIVRGEAPAYTLTLINQAGIWKAVALHTSQ